MHVFFFNVEEDKSKYHATSQFAQAWLHVILQYKMQKCCPPSRQVLYFPGQALDSGKSGITQSLPFIPKFSWA